MILVTIFVSLPFVVREVVPSCARSASSRSRRPHARRLTLADLQEGHAAVHPLGVAYGVVLTTARALGEFGAVSVVSGHIVGKTETLTLHVEAQYQQFDYTGAYAASVVLAMIAIATLVAMTLFKPKEETR